jgi:glycerol-1-phosphate dehydrogenase [NAD(P)+]
MLSHPLHARCLPVPLRFEVVSTQQARAEAIAASLADAGATSGFVLLLSGARKTAKIAESVHRALGSFATHRREIAHPTFGVADCIYDECEALGISALVAVGGGKVIDVAKAVCSRARLPLLAVPTALASDCISSPITVLIDSGGTRRTTPAVPPSSVIVDTSVTVAAPRELSVSGLCDVLSNASALLDAGDGAVHTGVGVDALAAVLSEGAYRLVLPLDWSVFHTAPGHEKLARALILSGLAMACAGTSVPCSGAEHAISHALDALGKGNVHGIQVGVATLYCHFLRVRLGKTPLPEDVVQLLQAIDPPLTPRHIGVSRAEFLGAVAVGATWRKDRFTVLNETRDKEIFSAAFEMAFPDDAG